MARQQAKRRYRRGEEVERILKEFEASGGSVAEFAQSRGINVWTFRGWIRRHSGVHRRRLVRVRVADRGTPGALALEIMLTNGRMVRVPAGFDAAALAALLPVLEQC